MFIFLSLVSKDLLNSENKVPTKMFVLDLAFLLIYQSIKMALKSKYLVFLCHFMTLKYHYMRDVYLCFYFLLQRCYNNFYTALLILL